MLKYAAVWRRERRKIEWFIDHAYQGAGSGDLLGEGTRVSEVYTAAQEYDLAHGGDGEIGRRFRITNPTDLHCVDCLCDIAPWDEDDFINKDGLCSPCREQKAQHA